ncbi:MAG TPA: ribosome silencing factor [Armatimonadota bacterium]|nr:ribosome silencing factor [Armatimonadota bacterium]HOS44142.1 ribosome silencing factor [Armatimonadota bacterium]
MDSLDVTRFVTTTLMEKKALELVALDLRGLTIIADFFVVATGASAPHLRALVEAVQETAKRQGITGVRAEGEEASGWVLLDLGEVVVHLFNPEQREFYKLERLWADAERLPLPEGGTP